MNVKDVKIGEEFSKDGKRYIKKPDGTIECITDNKHVSDVQGDVIIERTIING